MVKQHKVVAGSVAEADAPGKSEQQPGEQRTGPLVLVSDLHGKLRTATIGDLHDSGWNPRLSLPRVPELAESIRATGLEGEIYVAQIEGRGDKTFVIRGHRRLAAIKLIVESGKLGKFNPEKIAVRDFGKLSPKVFQRMMIDHNSIGLRGELEQARAADFLRQAGMTQDEIANHMNFSRSRVQFLLGVQRLPPEIRTAYAEALAAKDAGKKPDEDPTVPVFDQRTLQRLVTANNVKFGIGRKDEKDADFKPIEVLWAEWEKDKGRSLRDTNAANIRQARPEQELREMIARFSSSGKAATKDVAIAVLEWACKVEGAEERVRAYLDA